MEKKFSNICRAISGVVLFTFIAKVMGFIREILLSYYYGATGISDAYLISQTIPGTIFQLVGTGLTTCFIPIYYKILKERDNAHANRFTNQIMTIVFIFSTVVIVLVWLETPLVVRMFASGFTGKTFFYAVWFTRIGILSLYFSSMIYVFNSYLQANNIFGPTAFAAIPNSLFIMLSIVLSAKYNLWLLSIGSALAVGGQLLFLLPAIFKNGYKLYLDFHWKNDYIKQFFKLMLPVVVGVSVNEINTLVDRTIASQIAIGGISALVYANSLIQFVQGGIVQPVATVCYPQITASVSKKNIDEAKNVLEKSICLLLGILVPVSAGLIVYSRPIIGVLFARGAFDEQAIMLTSIAVRFYAVGICFVGIREFISRYFYANSNTVTPMTNATFGVVANIILNITLSRFWGIGGLALATSLSSVITAILLWKDCAKKIPGGPINLDLIQIIRICVATFLMVIVSYGVYNILSLDSVVSLILAILTAIVIYMLCGGILKVDIVLLIFGIVKKCII